MLRVWLPITLLFAGCTHVRTFDARDTGPLSTAIRTEINDRVGQRAPVVTLASGEQVNARFLHIAPDVATWMESGGLRTVPASDVHRVRFTSQGRGAIEGAGIGLLVGVPAGALIGWATGTDCSSSDWICIFDRQASAVAGGVLFGGLGTLVGGIVGASRKSRTVYAPEGWSPIYDPPVGGE